MKSDCEVFLRRNPMCLSRVRKFLDTLGPDRIISITASDTAYVVWFWEPLKEKPT